MTSPHQIDVTPTHRWLWHNIPASRPVMVSYFTGQRLLAEKRLERAAARAAQPPFVPGLPGAGNLLAFIQDPIGLIREGYEQYGDLFAIRLGGQKAAVLIGPEHHDFFFSATDDILRMQEVYSFLIPMFGEKIAFVADEAEYREQRAIFLPAFSGRKMAGYVQAMVRETEAWLDGLGEAGEFELVETFGHLAMFVAARAFMGDAFRQQVGSQFFDLYRDLAAGIEFILPPNLPLPRFRRRDRARDGLRALVEPIIAARRVESGAHDDFLQTLVEARYSYGEPLPDSLIANIIMGMVFAGHETTTGHMSWGLVQLLQHPDYLARVQAEVDSVLAEERPFDRSTLRQLSLLEQALRETERMEPVSQLLMRYTAKPYERGGYQIPAGWLTIISPAVAHRLPHLFSQPDRYDPDRFGPERAEDRQHRHSLIGFGGGRHKCTGMSFAYTEMQVVLSLLLHRYELTLPNPRPRQSPETGTNRPEPTLIRYRRRRAQGV